jgi:hypothetical protein
MRHNRVVQLQAESPPSRQKGRELATLLERLAILFPFQIEVVNHEATNAMPHRVFANMLD